MQSRTGLPLLLGQDFSSSTEDYSQFTLNQAADTAKAARTFNPH
jgi:hypothetical protein